MTSPVSDAMICAGGAAVLKTAHLSGCERAKIIYLAMVKAKEEAADYWQQIEQDHSQGSASIHFVDVRTPNAGKAGNQSPADEVERKARWLAGQLRSLAHQHRKIRNAELARIFDEAATILSAIRNTPQAIEATPCSDGESEK